MMYVIQCDGQYLTKDKSGSLTDKLEHAKMFFAKGTANNYAHQFFNIFNKTRIDYSRGWITVPYNNLNILAVNLVPAQTYPIDTNAKNNKSQMIVMMSQTLGEIRQDVQ